MSIDTGLSLSYNANFPTPNIDQSSQQFRDNFAIIKQSIESLEIAQSNSSSIVAITTTQGSAGQITINAAFQNNTFNLPIGYPSSGSPSTGMICYDPTTQTVQWYNGSAWLQFVFKDATGAVTLAKLTIGTNLTLNFTPSASTDAVNVGYVTNAIAATSNSVAFQISQINANIATTQSNLSAEATTRANADTGLQNQINALSSQVGSVSANTTAAQANVANFQQSLSNEANARIAADNNLSARINTLSNTVSNTSTLVSQLQTGLQTETLTRQTDEQAIYTYVNTIANSVTLVNQNLQAEANTRSTTDGILQASIAQTQNDLLNMNAVIQQEFADLTTTLGNGFIANTGGTMVGDLNFANANLNMFDANGVAVLEANTLTYTLTLANSAMTISNGSLYLNNSSMVMNANQYLYFQTVPNRVGGADGAFIVWEQNSFDYFDMSAATANTVAADIAANGIANADTHYEAGCLRIATTNDYDNGVNGDSIALEPAADLWLNPGWTGVENGEGYLGNSRVAVSNLGTVYVGNATNWTVQIPRANGNITTTGSITANGNITTYGNIVASGDITGLSDETLKYNVRDIESPLDIVSKLKGHWFNRNDLDGDPEQLGVIAQEVQHVLPQLVHETQDGTLSVAHIQFIALLIESVKDLKNQVAELKSQLANK